MKTRNKLVRMSKVLSMAFIIFLQIYWYKIRRKPQAEWDILWGKIGERYRKTLFELEGLLIKVGQILSTRADLLPKAFISQIEDLTDKVPPSNWSEIEEILAAMGSIAPATVSFHRKNSRCFCFHWRGV